MWITAPSTTSYVNQKCLQTPPSVPWTAKPPAAGDRWWSLPESQHVGTGGFIGGSWRSRFAQTCLPGPARPWCCWSPFSLILVWASVETDTVSSAVQAVRSLGVDPPAVGSLSPPLPIPLLRLPALYRRAAWSPWGGCSRLFWFKKLPFFFRLFFNPKHFSRFPLWLCIRACPWLLPSMERGSGHTSQVSLAPGGHQRKSWPPNILSLFEFLPHQADVLSIRGWF